jgi:hypothetical protein
VAAGTGARGTGYRCTRARIAARAAPARNTRGPDGARAGGIQARQPQPEAAEPVPADDGRAARLDELQARADQAARRIDAHRAALGASSQHAVRVERDAQADPAADRQAEMPYDMEMEL